MRDNNKLIPKYWVDKNKNTISCKEKIKVINGNLDELTEMLKDIFDEAVLIGVDENQFKKVIQDIVKNMKNTIKDV
ncbi:MAG: hypothetical protein CFH34_01770 [Alphaproteobacteria bacterium MarineAlpha9_Bin4]|nr:MAG: hypothetical protein CFH34_01770 [Alphaproteobacteria bacterium MarineAlpha9_Bin4]|tara:strand:- start:1140 stop:1367 length:228 start_codon:yes stop_codon:yes gene_type:complete